MRVIGVPTTGLNYLDYSDETRKEKIEMFKGTKTRCVREMGLFDEGQFRRLSEFGESHLGHHESVPPLEVRFFGIFNWALFEE